MAAWRELVDSHDDLEISEEGKVRCVSTGHEFGSIESDPNRLMELINQYLSGKKYKMSTQCYSQSFDHYEYIIPNKKHPKKLFCQVCSTPLNRIPKQVEAHLQGRRHQARLKEQEAANQPSESIADEIAKKFESDDEEMDSEHNITANEDNSFEVVPQSDFVPTMPMTSKYDSSDDDMF